MPFKLYFKAVFHISKVQSLTIKTMLCLWEYIYVVYTCQANTILFLWCIIALHFKGWILFLLFKKAFQKIKYKKTSQLNIPIVTERETHFLFN